MALAPIGANNREAIETCYNVTLLCIVSTINQRPFRGHRSGWSVPWVYALIFINNLLVDDQ
jgi:hypothetical protein